MSIIDELASALSPDRVVLDAPTLAAYAVDQAPVLDYQLPRAVVFAESVDDVQATVRACAARGVPLVARGAGTGVSGGAHASEGSVVLSLERMNRILDLNPHDETAVVEPGVINADLNAAAAAYGLMFAPDPASFKMSTIGGNVATNAGGLCCVKYGVTRDYVIGLQVVTGTGELVRRSGRPTARRGPRSWIGCSLTRASTSHCCCAGTAQGHRLSAVRRPAAHRDYCVADKATRAPNQGYVTGLMGPDHLSASVVAVASAPALDRQELSAPVGPRRLLRWLGNMSSQI
jgi:hypothetical protein